VGGIGLLLVQAGVGAATGLTKIPSEDWAHEWPSFLPDRRRPASNRVPPEQTDICRGGWFGAY
jgi:hypothetical protein